MRAGATLCAPWTTLSTLRAAPIPPKIQRAGARQLDAGRGLVQAQSIDLLSF